MAYYEQPPYQQPNIPTPEQQQALKDQNAPPPETAPPPEDPGPSIPEPPPTSIPPSPSSNSPLALQGSFAQPGTSGAKAFRTGGFFAPERLVDAAGPIRFGQGQGLGFGKSPITGQGGGGHGRPGEDDDRIRAFISSLQQR